MSIEHIAGKHDASGLRIAIVASRFNQYIVDPMIEAATDTLAALGMSADQLTIARVPGAWELPLAAQLEAARGVDAIIALGALIRGETKHFDYVASQCAQGLGEVMINTGVPVAFGVLTLTNAQQGIARAGGNLGNRGVETARSAVEMARLKQLRA